jgi:allene oxide cyclase
MRRVMMKMGAGLVACAGLLGCGGEDEAADATTTRTVHVVEHIVSETVTDVGEPKDSVGDVLTFANELFDETNTKQIGTDQGYCLRVVVGASWECAWTAFLAEGQITVEGPFHDAKGSTLAITGGTGAFQGAGGEMELKFRENALEYDFIYKVVLAR